MKIDIVDKLIFTLACIVTMVWMTDVGIKHIYLDETFQAVLAFLAAFTYAYTGSKLWWHYK